MTTGQLVVSVYFGVAGPVTSWKIIQAIRWMPYWNAMHMRNGRTCRKEVCGADTSGLGCEADMLIWRCFGAVLWPILLAHKLLVLAQQAVVWTIRAAAPIPLPPVKDEYDQEAEALVEEELRSTRDVCSLERHPETCNCPDCR